MIFAAAMMSSIYDEHKDEDGFLYFTYSGENTFGDVITCQLRGRRKLAIVGGIGIITAFSGSPAVGAFSGSPLHFVESMIHICINFSSTTDLASVLMASHWKEEAGYAEVVSALCSMYRNIWELGKM